MSNLLQFFSWIPLITLILSMIPRRTNEKVISGIAITGSVIHLLSITAFIIYWLSQNHPVLDIKHIVLFNANDIEIFIDFYFDQITAVFGWVGSLLTCMILRYSKFYLHRDEGFKRYFTTILLFFTSYNMLIFSGNFETLFIGWEVLGICSFLLISFYRNRYLPVRNGLKVISLFRLADICLILAMWMSHHLWHKNITFISLNDHESVLNHIQEHNWYAFFIALMILIAAMVKSAMLPFSSWLPRAMEGPTTSSAIFYGSLSVHIGIFLLLRTYPYWQDILSIKVALIVVGALTSIISNSIANVQSSVKVQIAYASVAQIGLMAIEIALGWHVLALIHFAGNAFLRTYQLLVSPSVLSYRIHKMAYTFKPTLNTETSGLMKKLNNTVYMLSIKEWNLDAMLQQIFWRPFKMLGTRLNYIQSKFMLIFVVFLLVAGIVSHYLQEYLHEDLLDFLPHVFSITAFLMVLQAFADRRSAIHAWWLVIASQLSMSVSVALLNENFGNNHISIYLSGSVLSAVLGFFCLKKIQQFNPDISLNKFHGYIHNQPGTAFLFLLACFGMAGLPFTPTFIGIDLLFSHIHMHEEILIIFTAMTFMLIEITVLRIYARIFLGLNQANDHASAYRSS